MAEEIGVTYLYVRGGGYHMALYYFKNDGTKKVIEFGPAGWNAGPSVTSKEVAQELGIVDGDPNRASPLGLLKGGERPWVPGDELLDREILKQGDNLNTTWGGMVQTAKTINDRDLQYFLFQQNSNSVVRTVVDGADVNRPSGVGETFDGELKPHWVPAGDKPISLDGPQSGLDKPSDILSANARFDDDINIDRIDATLLDGRKLILEYDTKDTHLYDELDILKGPDGKVIAAQVTLDPDVLAAGMSIGQIFGSAIGGALGGNDLIGRLTGSAIGGLVAQKFVQVLATAMTADLSTVSLNDVFASQGISVANAGFGVISSFLTAELGHALHIDGFDGQLFNTAASGFTTSLLIQVKDEMVRGGLDFAGAIAAIDWTQAVSNAIDAAQINLGNLLGAYLGHELVPAQTREGAIGGQLFGAIGSFILPGGLGSLIGTILGTWIGNQFGTQASPSATDLLDQAGDHYESHPYQSADQGSYEAPDKMGAAAASIINAYLGAVDGAALDHSKQVVIGYSKNPDVLYITGTPTNPNRSFTDANDAVHAAALDVLQNLEVIGGNLLMKRAHQYSPSIRTRNRRALSRVSSRGARRTAAFSRAVARVACIQLKCA